MNKILHQSYIRKTLLCPRLVSAPALTWEKRNLSLKKDSGGDFKKLYFFKKL